MLPSRFKNVLDFFTRLPSLGPRQSIRLIFHLSSWNKSDLRIFGESIIALTEMKTCPMCFFIHENENDLCEICNDHNRRKDIIAIVEKQTDIVSLEQTKKMNNHYFIIGDIKRNFAASANYERINILKKRIDDTLSGKAAEIILAISPTTYGDIITGTLTHELFDYAHKISRLARGIPTGGDIEFADEDTLRNAIDNRK
ncbi:MAG: hypothetical protein A3A04_00125 [Candidatus Harrisonbacteria bacterium RIFCSPLOWO2_01_FULL_40_28]|uniref:Recombination protein RecR n=1 Tax=Candidatus Harrisonbacteria bacterium RIFCSPLOWO2_01_FULL_40_28 TaxID=1798406 RepID=A0A1G1ZLX2_9BACT|nr:MAG: hypothetical protein A3A04_00125 [Candidatus Harrisonbacteria bacterium RIFCSPLOWO2_01_FULL_40_28]